VCPNLPYAPVFPIPAGLASQPAFSSAAATNHSHSPPYPRFIGVTAANSTDFHRFWNSTRTVPAWLLLIVFPLVSIRSPAFLSRFNALGTLSILYLINLVLTKASSWGINMNLTAKDEFFGVPLAGIDIGFTLPLIFAPTFHCCINTIPEPVLGESNLLLGH
ncbi:unnamed protein product, partial [Protopolystoma xenopodis]